METDWVTKEASEFCSSVRDGTHDSPREVFEGGKNLVTSRHIKGGILDFTKSYKISTSDFDEINQRSKVNQWDVLFSMIGTIGEVLLVKDKEPDYAIKNVGLFKCKSELDGKWLYYYLNSPLVKREILSLSRGTTQQYIPLGSLRKLSVRYPNSDLEKRKIIRFLSSIDEKIELNKKTNRTLEEIAKAIFKSWFIDFDPVKAKSEGRSTGLPEEISDLFPDSFEDSELGKIPIGWEISNIGEISEVIDCLHSKKPAREDHGHLLLQLNNITDNGILDISDKYLITNNDYEKWTSRMETKQGDCVITNVGRVGAVSQIPREVKAALGRNMTAIRAKDVFPFPTFILEYLLSTLGRNEIRLNIDVGTILNALNVKSIPKLRFTHPGVDLCRHYENLSRPFREKMEQIHNENESISLLRNVILPKLISGELRIPDAEKMIEEVGV